MMTGLLPAGAALFGVPTVFGFFVPFRMTALGLLVPFGVTAFGLVVPLGVTALGLTTPFGDTFVPVLTLFSLVPGATVFEPALFGMTLFPLFIDRAWSMQLARRPGNRLWQLVPGG
jgi:hypothetical protein